MKIALIAVSALVLLVLLVVVVVAVGYMLPQDHRASRERDFAVAPNRVFGAIATPSEFPKWRGDVKRVEMLPDEGGRPRFREEGSNGDIVYQVEERVPDRRLVTRIADRSLPFGGSWTYELTPTVTGTSLKITENGEVYNPLFRFMSRFVFGHHRTIDTYLASLDRHLAP
jgi:uncharacterized protein YndB with AHSA1/START domain